ncbi:MAG: hypothetical protein U5L09_11670 [Bacteroidales bacterium]|nr:hypothetical protein [Bacteroidales bacterium]
MPRTRFHDDDKNLVNKLFWGRAPITMATSFLFFRRHGIVQQLMHQFKYKGEKDIGEYLGKLFAQELVEKAAFADVDVIIPIPLHPKKEKKEDITRLQLLERGWLVR